jgi:hypothetical protein
MKHFLRAGITALACSLLIISCKKDKQSNPDPTQNNFLPNAGTYTYHFASTDGVAGDETVTVSGKRDTANGKAVTMTSVSGGFHLSATRYADAANTIDPIYPPKEFDSLANLIRSQGAQVTYDGWPVYQKMPNTAALNDVFSFSGGPIHLHFVAPGSFGDWTLEHLNGKVVQTNQKITTPAGTYTCSVWAYGIKTTTVTIGGTFVSNYYDTIWMAPGVPFVKSSEQTPNSYSVTMLTRAN